MASLTPNLQLTKPEATDKIDPQVFANNFQTIDTAIAARKLDSASANIVITSGESVVPTASTNVLWVFPETVVTTE